MDPRQVLGVSADASEAEIREAYLRNVKQYPPDRSPAEFERIRDAYDTLRDPRRRIEDMLNAGDPYAPFTSLLEGVSVKRLFTRPDHWLEVLKGK